MTPQRSSERLMSDQTRREGRRFTFRRRHRLSGAKAFRRVRREGLRAARGPLVVFARPNGLDHPRLGLAVPRRAGTAVARNRIKRRLREAFRLMQHEMPSGYDLVAQVRPHRPLSTEEYRRRLASCWRKLDERWRAQNVNNQPPTPPPTSQ